MRKTWRFSSSSASTARTC